MCLSGANAQSDNVLNQAEIDTCVSGHTVERANKRYWAVQDKLVTISMAFQAQRLLIEELNTLNQASTKDFAERGIESKYVGQSHRPVWMDDATVMRHQRIRELWQAIKSNEAVLGVTPSYEEIEAYVRPRLEAYTQGELEILDVGVAIFEKGIQGDLGKSIDELREQVIVRLDKIYESRGLTHPYGTMFSLEKSAIDLDHRRLRLAYQYHTTQSDKISKEDVGMLKTAVVCKNEDDLSFPDYMTLSFWYEKMDFLERMHAYLWDFQKYGGPHGGWLPGTDQVFQTKMRKIKDAVHRTAKGDKLAFEEGYAAVQFLIGDIKTDKGGKESFKNGYVLEKTKRARHFWGQRERLFRGVIGPMVPGYHIEEYGLSWKTAGIEARKAAYIAFMVGGLKSAPIYSRGVYRSTGQQVLVQGTVYAHMVVHPVLGVFAFTRAIQEFGYGYWLSGAVMGGLGIFCFRIGANYRAMVKMKHRPNQMDAGAKEQFAKFKGRYRKDGPTYIRIKENIAHKIGTPKRGGHPAPASQNTGGNPVSTKPTGGAGNRGSSGDGGGTGVITAPAKAVARKTSPSKQPANQSASTMTGAPKAGQTGALAEATYTQTEAVATGALIQPVSQPLHELNLQEIEEIKQYVEEEKDLVEEESDAGLLEDSFLKRVLKRVWPGGSDYERLQEALKNPSDIANREFLEKQREKCREGKGLGPGVCALIEAVLAAFEHGAMDDWDLPEDIVASIDEQFEKKRERRNQVIYEVLVKLEDQLPKNVFETIISSGDVYAWLIDEGTTSESDSIGERLPIWLNQSKNAIKRRNNGYLFNRTLVKSDFIDQARALLGTESEHHQISAILDHPYFGEELDVATRIAWAVEKSIDANVEVVQVMTEVLQVYEAVLSELKFENGQMLNLLQVWNVLDQGLASISNLNRKVHERYSNMRSDSIVSTIREILRDPLMLVGGQLVIAQALNALTDDQDLVLVLLKKNPGWKTNGYENYRIFYFNGEGLTAHDENILMIATGETHPTHEIILEKLVNLLVSDRSYDEFESIHGSLLDEIMWGAGYVFISHGECQPRWSSDTMSRAYGSTSARGRGVDSPASSEDRERLIERIKTQLSVLLFGEDAPE